MIITINKDIDQKRLAIINSLIKTEDSIESILKYWSSVFSKESKEESCEKKCKYVEVTPESFHYLESKIQMLEEIVETHAKIMEGFFMNATIKTGHWD